MMRAWLGLALSVFAFASALADERILEFHSDIHVLANGDVEIAETVKVRAEGKRIQRGIYRDQFTDYRDGHGNRVEAAIEVLSLTRDGEPESYHRTSIDRGVRTYFGDRDRSLPHGEHTYVYRYRVKRTLGFFPAYDELYRTVTGFDWAFVIDQASARVSFDFKPPMNQVHGEAYTGPYGARGGDYRVEKEDDQHSLSFVATRPLSATNGLTIVVTWPKGYVTEPTRAQRIGWLIADNRNLLIALGGLLLLLGYCIPVWKSHGRDPDEGPIVTRYEPPTGFSPASLRYINQMYYDNKVMTAAIVNLAVKGYLRINRHGDTHSLTRLTAGADAPPLATGERELYDGLFKSTRAITLSNDNHSLLGKARAAHKASLQNDYKFRYFRTNTYLNIPGLVIVLGTVAAALLSGPGLSFYLLAVFALMLVTLIFFAVIMKRPTMRGRKLLDELQGFRDYLDVAEKEELNLRNPPDKTPQLFESYLPFALALGVDQSWAEKFSAVLASVRGPDGQAWQPGWYSGQWSKRSMSANATSLSSGLNSAVSSSVTPPGSSSGSGGGGFSGGGGGGGGGGGW